MPALTEVLFLSQTWAEAYIPRRGEALVSITDHGAPDANLKEGWAAVLRVSFDDVDPIESPLELGEDLVELQEPQAGRIAAFVAENSRQVGTFVVHCRYGQSRSAGVAKAIAHAYGLHFPENYEYANNFVYELVLQALRRQSEA